ncbi:iron ABC transporter permease [Streptomyces cocklensis]|jgi:iron complex transport system permease protein|uniref:Ferric enterobactin ABC transporter membrane subunit FebD n=1 Tax=Actinacidiphila cocklensis TaxID=887465 RepID=A0A9W4GR14_9ACTN|nr:iron ABC transporter permease [Actinacidiphila cocklensis]MDD1057520.1 iron ABC transporter permease [Actinacidiphila cocklensis]WSX78959.1 iron ABC transporter permease [Streptomyces sp. NBC_00899]CAG6393856.1 ferric enterobactin ABC transporter membrane subunit FebD [Actinacidiphila cocklensis]
MHLRRRTGWMAAATAALLLAVLLSLAVGSREIPPSQVFDALLHGGTSQNAEVVRSLRVPRTVIGIMVGAALAVAGVVMQGVTRNPIAEPGILGVSQGASLGVVCAIAYAGVGTLSGYVWFAFAGAGAAAVAVYAVAARGRGGASPVKLALAGAAMNAFLASVVSGVLTTDAQTLETYRFWQVGSLSGRDTDIIGMIWPFLAVGLLLVLAMARGLDALALGEDVAKGLGQNVALLRLTGALGATVLTGAAVAAAGPIAFVGLAVPHLARALVGTAHRWVLPMAALLGPVMILVSDVVGRIVFPPSEVPVAVMTSLIGVPFLVALVRRRSVVAA